MAGYVACSAVLTPCCCLPAAQLALYLAGNALSVFIGLLLWNLNTVRGCAGCMRAGR
jgi:hypothetical protein